MKSFALFAALVFLAACGKEETSDYDKSTNKVDVEKVADKTPPASISNDAPKGGAEMRVITVQIDGMT